MAKKDKEKTPSGTEEKRRWYQNLADAYRVASRTYRWLPWAMGGLVLVILAAAVLIGILTNGLLWTMISAVMLSVLSCMILLSSLLRPAMYTQLEGKVGSAYSVISQIKRGWVVDEQPAIVTKEQDIVWRLIGRPGVVFIAEGPTSRVIPLMKAEKRKVNRITANVPVHFIQVGLEDGQVSLKKLSSTLRKLKPVLTKQEVPAVAARINAVSSKSSLIPKGVDPYNTRGNRRALRG